MRAHVALHVRELPGGPAVVTPIPFADLAQEAATVTAAKEALRPVLKQRLESLEPVDRLPYAEPPDATLLRVPVEVRVGGKDGEPLGINLGVVAVARRARRGRVLVAWVPVLPKFEILQGDGDVARLAQRVAAGAGTRLKSWTPEYLLNADEP